MNLPSARDSRSIRVFATGLRDTTGARFSCMVVTMSDEHKKTTDKKPVVPANEPPAQEIADDEVEIAETGGKPGDEEE